MASFFWRHFPKTIRLGPHDLSVQFGPIETKDPEEEAIFGSFSAANLMIELSDAVPTQTSAIEVGLHELCHALLAPLSLKFAEEERICGVIGSGLAQVLRDNPAIIKWLANIEDGNDRSKQ